MLFSEQTPHHALSVLLYVWSRSFLPFFLLLSLFFLLFAGFFFCFFALGFGRLRCCSSPSPPLNLLSSDSSKSFMIVDVWILCCLLAIDRLRLFLAYSCLFLRTLNFIGVSRGMCGWIRWVFMFILFFLSVTADPSISWSNFFTAEV